MRTLERLTTALIVIAIATLLVGGVIWAGLRNGSKGEVTATSRDRLEVTLTDTNGCQALIFFSGEKAKGLAVGDRVSVIEAGPWSIITRLDR